MKKIFGFIFFLFLCGVLAFTIVKREEITKYVVVNYVYKKSEQNIKNNKYKKDLNISFVKETDNFFPNNKQDILNIFYTELNSGSNEFTYYCLDSYPNCINDSNELINEAETLSIINNFVHPYNSYDNLSFTINSFGRIEVKVNKQYTDEMIKVLDEKVDSIIASELNDSMSLQDKILKIHDYIITNSKYDRETAEDNKKSSDNESDNAYGVLMEGYGICSGFSDTMELFLSKLGVTSYKISSPTHIWNLVYIDDSWKHLDLTWDNPVVNTGEKLLLHDFYLIDTPTLKNLDEGHHNYDEKIYKEA